MSSSLAGPFNQMCAQWRHLVSACEVKAHPIGCWQYLSAVCFWQPLGYKPVVAALRNSRVTDCYPA